MKKVYVVYCSYPYTEDPQRFTAELKEWALRVYRKHDDLVLLLPHFVFDAVFDFPNNFQEIVERHGQTNIAALPVWELTLIERCDIFAYNPARLSHGVIWERAYAEKIGVPITTMEVLENGWRP